MEMANERFVQVGIIAARDPTTGEMSQSVPIFREVTPSQITRSERDFDRIEKVMADKMKRYMDAQRKAQSKPKNSARKGKHHEA